MHGWIDTNNNALAFSIQAFKACMKLRTPLRYALTGTPMPNRYGEGGERVVVTTRG